MLASLTRREVEILRRLGSGRTNKEIAVALGLEVQTIKNAVTRIYHKLHVSTRSDAARVAIGPEGIVHGPDRAA